MVTGEVRLKLFKGTCSIQGRRSPHSLYDPRLANQTNLELFDNQWAKGFTSLWSLPILLAALQQEARHEWRVCHRYVRSLVNEARHGTWRDC